METTPDREIAKAAAAQHGVFTVAQAAKAGLRRDQREFRVRVGRWEPVHPGIYRLAGAPESWRGRLLAECWAVRGFAVASHRSAAELWSLPGGRTDLVEITCHRSRRAKRSGLQVHETKLLRAEDTSATDGIPVTSVNQTLLGLAAVVRPGVVDMALDRALLQKMTTRADLESFIEQKAQRGRNGVSVLRQLVENADPLAGIPESAMETKLKRLLRRLGLPTPVFQYVIRHQGRFVARVDAAYPDLRIAIEFDSYEHHTGKLALVRDNDRRNQLAGIRWRTVTFTAADIQRDGGQAAEVLRLARREAASASFGATGA